MDPEMADAWGAGPRGTQDDVAFLARLHAATAQHQGFEPVPLDHLAILYRRLAPAGHAELFVGEIEGRPVAARLSPAAAVYSRHAWQAWIATPRRGS